MCSPVIKLPGAGVEAFYVRIIIVKIMLSVLRILRENQMFSGAFDLVGKIRMF